MSLLRHPLVRSPSGRTCFRHISIPHGPTMMTTALGEFIDDHGRFEEQEIDDQDAACFEDE